MKKLKLSAIIVCMVMVAALCFSGCAFLKGAEYLTVKEMPKTQFNQNEKWVLSETSLKEVGFSFTIQVKNSEGTFTYVFGRDADASKNETAITMGEGADQFSIKGFDLSKSGSFLATIKIGSANGTFQYKVIGQGKGTSETDAIKISTAEDFYEMEAWTGREVDSSKKDVYYELTNDIDFGVVNDSILNAFSGHLNGKGHKVTATFTNKGNSAAGTFKGTGLVFILLSDAELKNIDFDLTGGDNSICRNMLNKVVMNNVDRYGSSTALKSNRGLYVAQFCGYIYGGELMMVKNENGVVTDYVALSRMITPLDITMVECDNYADMSSTFDIASAYFAYGIGEESAPEFKDSKLTMERCNNYGEINGQNSSVFLGNASFLQNEVRKHSKVYLTDCYNYGKVAGGTSANVIMSHSDDDVEKYSDVITVKASGKTGNACATELNKTLDNKTKGSCSIYTKISLKNITKNEDGFVVINSESIKNELGATPAYYRIAVWFEAYVFGKGESGQYDKKIMNTKQHVNSMQYNAPASGSLTTDYYFLSATTGEGTIATEVGRMLLEKDGKKYYAFQESVDSITDTATKLSGTESKVEFRIYCYDANSNVIGYVGFDSSSTIGK